MTDDDAYLHLTGQRSTHGYGHAQDPATDDIVTRLRHVHDYLVGQWPAPPDDFFTVGLDAADEISRLRHAGDAAVECLGLIASFHDDPQIREFIRIHVDAWREARRG